MAEGRAARIARIVDIVIDAGDGDRLRLVPVARREGQRPETVAAPGSELDGVTVTSPVGSASSTTV